MTAATSGVAQAYDPDRIAARRQAVAATVDRIRAIEAEFGVNQAALDAIQTELRELATRKDLFSPAEFPNPEPGTPARLYLLSEDEDGRFPLYLTCAAPGGAVRPHNHGVWAVVAGLDGVEENFFYDREAGGLEPGPARIALRKSVRVGEGESIGLLPDAIHSVATPGDVPRRHFHMYGLSLERLPKRLAYDTATETCAHMEINPKIVRVAHA